MISTLKPFQSISTVKVQKFKIRKTLAFVKKYTFFTDQKCSRKGQEIRVRRGADLMHN